MAVKVGNSWVSEEAYAYVKAKMDAESQKSGETLSELSKKFPDLKFTTNTAPFSGKGTNNMAIHPDILKQMENNPEKRLEYEALIYDCNQLMKGKSFQNRNLKSFGFIIDKNGGLSAWSISEKSNHTVRNKVFLNKNDKNSWLDRILEKKKQEKAEIRKKERKAQQEKMLGTKLDKKV